MSAVVNSPVPVVPITNVTSDAAGAMKCIADRNALEYISVQNTSDGTFILYMDHDNSGTTVYNKYAVFDVAGKCICANLDKFLAGTCHECKVSMQLNELLGTVSSLNVGTLVNLNFQSATRQRSKKQAYLELLLEASLEASGQAFLEPY